ncbi:hypothetical protein [Mycoplasma sp. SG1]|uniref:hypothetical protein n=1 Tax=Mycoplasma sp. SG1 TaxID=2810348 RepID=UPI002023FAF3|nr:hypothetical protein [Mycoplasma sp. SG1]URM53035.1 hypothetical protein JRW51_01670 [Mycoplasma sp. SG1]
MINFKKTIKYILNTGGLTLVSLGMFAGCGCEKSDWSLDKSIIKKTLDDLFNKGIKKGHYNGLAVKNPNFNVLKDDDDAINDLVLTGRKTNSPTGRNLSVSSVISKSIIANGDGTTTVEATVVINDADIPVPTKDSFTTDKFTNPANNFIYTIAYIINKNGNVIDFTHVNNDVLKPLEFYGDGLTTSNQNSDSIGFNPNWVKYSGFDAKKINKNIKGVPLLDNRINWNMGNPLEYADNGHNHLLSLGNAFFLAVRDYNKDPKLQNKIGFFDYLENLPLKGSPISQTFNFAIGYTKDLTVLVNKVCSGYNWSINSSQLTFAEFNIKFVSKEENQPQTTVYAPIVSSTQILTAPTSAEEVIKHLGFYGAVDFQYSDTSSNKWLGYRAYDLGIF